jgi:predicted ATP-dependent endonuclease of OLD family
LLYEEPETYLHPHLRRKLRDVIAKLSSAGWVCVCATHAPEFISFSQAQSIVRLWRTAGNTERGSIVSADVEDAPKFQEKLDERGTHEFLFANRVVLVEGKDDAFALRMFFEKTGVDVDGLGLTILNGGGVESLPAYARIAKALQLPWYALTDEDRRADSTIKPKTDAARKTLDTIKTNRDAQGMWKGSLEQCLNCPGNKAASPEWQQANVWQKTAAQIATQYPDFHKACVAIVEWLSDF